MRILKLFWMPAYFDSIMLGSIFFTLLANALSHWGVDKINGAMEVGSHNDPETLIGLKSWAHDIFLAKIVVYGGVMVLYVWLK